MGRLDHRAVAPGPAWRGTAGIPDVRHKGGRYTRKYKITAGSRPGPPSASSAFPSPWCLGVFVVRFFPSPKGA